MLKPDDTDTVSNLDALSNIVAACRVAVGLATKHRNVKSIGERLTKVSEQLAGRFRVRPIGPIDEEQAGFGRSGLGSGCHSQRRLRLMTRGRQLVQGHTEP